MANRPSEETHRWRRPLLIAEFSALAILVGSMLILGRQETGQAPVSPAWLLVPAAASLVVFLSFLGLMYLRWVAVAAAHQNSRHKMVFAMLALTLLAVWAFAIAQTWNGISAQ